MAAVAAPPKAPACTLTSDVHNEAELLFTMLQHKDKLCVSSLDCLTILRGIGMNPTQGDMEALLADMAPYISELDDLRREEEKKREKEKKKEEDKKGGAKKAADAKAAKGGAADKGKAGAAAAGPPKVGPDGKPIEGTGDGKEGEGGERVKVEPSEEVKNIDWEIFITCVEPMYKDNRQEEREILAALGVFDTEQRGCISKTELCKILSENGESVLSPAEIKQFIESFSADVIEFKEFAQRLQGTYVPPPPPSAEEIAAKKAEDERIAAEAAKKAREENGDDLLS